MGLNERLLNRSNSYLFYKENYNKLKESQEKLEDEKKQLSLKYDSIKKENSNLKSEVVKQDEKIVELQKKLSNFIKPQIVDKLRNEQYSDLNIAIKTPNPKEEHFWGDYFFALSLKKSFEKLGFNVFIHDREDWYDNGAEVDINMVLRGKFEYKPDYDAINIMWNISHPDMVEIVEYENYDVCFISSEKYTGLLKDDVSTIVKPLLQCTDPDVFFNEKDDSINEEILFVGITRGVYRDIIKDVLKTDHDVSIYGMGWEKFIDDKFIKGQFIDNKELHKYYSSCKILLNDHWEDMREMDFPSNRLFDALACGTFVISDKIPSAETLFEGTVITYDDVDDLNKKLEYYLAHDEEREKIAERGKELVLNNHTFDNRVETIIDCLKNLDLNEVMK